MTALKSLLFLIFVPGMVAGYIPLALLRNGPQIETGLVAYLAFPLWSIGVMILLTLSIGFDSSINTQKEENITRLMITLAIIAPFTASAVLAILTNLSSNYTEQLKKTSIIIMAIGFGYLIFVIAAFMVFIFYLI